MGFASGFGIGAKPTLINFAGKTANFYGDSIVAQQGSFTTLKAYTGLTTVNNCGTNGRRLSVYGGYSSTVRLSHNDIYGTGAGVAYKTAYPNADFLIISIGINDCAFIDNAGSARKAAVKGTLSDTTYATFLGALHVLTTGLQALYPAARIILLAPLYADSVANSVYAGDVPTIVDAVNEFGADRGYSTFDQYANGGLNAGNIVSLTSSGDGLHPNATGRTLIDSAFFPWLTSLTY
jgi:lysophospholipase L1-like esterase